MPVNDSVKDVAVDDSIIDKDDILDALSDSPDDSLEELDDKSKLKTPKSDKLAEEDDDKEEVDKTEEEDDTKELELETDEELAFQDVPKRKEILKEFPEIFKKFPTIERALFREQEYAKVFPTLDDAKSAVDTIKEYNNLQKDVLNGDITGLLNQIKTTDEKAFSKITTELLDTLKVVDNTVWLQTVGTLINNSLYNVLQRAKALGGEDGEQLEIAAKLINKFYFETTDIKPISGKVTTQPDEKETKLSEREKDFAQRELSTAVNDITERVDGAITKYVKGNIDKNDVMTPYVRNKAVEDVLNQARKEMLQEPRFRTLYDKMWMDAAKENFSSSSREKIRGVLLRRAKAILPDVMRRVKADALKGTASRRLIDVDDDKRPSKNGEERAPRKSSSPSKEPTKNMSTMDFLNAE